jgi:hypothetical protein
MWKKADSALQLAVVQRCPVAAAAMISIPATRSSVSTWPAGWAYQEPASDARSLGKRPIANPQHRSKDSRPDDIAEIGHGVRYVRVGSAMMFPMEAVPGLRRAVVSEYRRVVRPPWEIPTALVTNGALMVAAWFLIPPA